MAFGSIGGVPQRVGGANSRVIEYLPEYADWLSGYNDRFRAESQVGGPTLDQLLTQQVQDYQAGAGNPNDFDKAFAYAKEALWGPGGEAFGSLSPNKLSEAQLGASPTNKEFATTLFGDDFWELAKYKQPKPDFSNLLTEKATMLPKFDARARAQQAYAQMTGNGQMNGMIGPGYTAPNFGKISGQQFDTKDPLDTDPTDMSWTNGAYMPKAGQGAGTFGSPGRRNTVWGI